MMYNSKIKFQVFTKNSYYLRVDATHPLELFIGLNDQGQKTLRLAGKYKKTDIKGTKSIEVRHYLHEQKLILSFSLIDETFVDLFYLFCNDIIDSSRNILIEDGYVYISNRFEKWRNFSNTTRKNLSEIEIKGLMGELLFIKEYLSIKYGISKTLLAWTGPEPTKKDFYFDGEWFEIKSSTKGLISISSMEQLESEQDGYLVVYFLEKTSPEGNGYTLNSLVNSILDMCRLVSDRSDFLSKLIHVGYDASDYYDNFMYESKERICYVVNKQFPRITRSMLPKEVSAIRYEIILNMIDNFERELL